MSVVRYGVQNMRTSRVTMLLTTGNQVMWLKEETEFAIGGIQRMAASKGMRTVFSFTFVESVDQKVTANLNAKSELCKRKQHKCEMAVL